MKHSAGILVFRRTGVEPEVLLLHLGGPLWEKRDCWSIPKGERDDGEDHLTAARREFTEETGISVPDGELIELGSSRKSGKANYIWAVEANPDISGFHSNTFPMEWPPHSGRMQEFPENDRAAWFTLTEARQKLFDSQIIFIDRLAALIA